MAKSPSESESVRIRIREFFKEHYLQLALIISFRINGNDADARDIIHEVYLYLETTAPAGFPTKAGEQLRYTIRCVLNAWMKREIKRNKRQSLSLDKVLSAPQATIVYDYGENSTEENLIRMIAKKADLKSIDIIMIRLAFIERLSGKEMAEILKIEENSVRVNLQRIRRKLRKYIQRDDFDSSNQISSIIS